MTGNDFKNSKWCKEGGTENGQAKVRKDFKAWTSRVGNYGLLAKARQLYEFFLSPKVTGTQKVIVVGALLYLISPLDLIPDFIPVAGWLDDLGVAAFALNYIFATLGRIEEVETESDIVPDGFKLSAQQVIDAEIIDEAKAVAFRLGAEPQVASPSLSLKKRFGEVSEIARILNVEGSDAVCDNFEKMIFDTRLFKVAVVGRYSTGKSTVLNALLSKNLLPSKPVPTTKAVTYLIKGNSCSIGAEYGDGTMRLEPDVDESAVLGVYNDMIAGGAKAVAIALPDFPFPDLALVDTPGIEDPDECIAQKTAETVRNCDAVVVLIDANYPQSEAEYHFVESIAVENVGRKLFVAINKCDGKSLEECNGIKATCQDELKRRGCNNVEVQTLSAIKRDEGFVSFQETLFSFLQSGIRSEVAAYANAELKKYAMSLHSVCSKLLGSAPEVIKDREEQEALLAAKRRQASACFERQTLALSMQIDGCKAQMKSDLANFIGELKSEVRTVINESDFATLRNTDAIAKEINKKLRAFVDGQLRGLGNLVEKELKRAGEALQGELAAVEITLPKQVNDPSGLSRMFFPVSLAASYLLFGLSTAFVGTLVFVLLGRNFFEGAIHDALENYGLANARTRIADDVSRKLGDCEKKIWLQVSEAVESVREKVLAAVESRRFECVSNYTSTQSSGCLSTEIVKDCRTRLTAVIDE